MRTDLGQSLRAMPLRSVAALCAGLAVAGADLLLAPADAFGAWRPFWALTALACVAAAAGWDPAAARAVGLRWRPLPGVGAWLRLALYLGLIVLGCALLWTLVAWLRGEPFEVRSQLRDVPDLGARLFRSCVRAPIDEELIYRVGICVPVVAVAGRLGPRVAAALAIVVSGLVFAWLHVRYGNPAPDNVVAGFVLAWAYLRSACLWIPIALHALGNLGVFALHWALLLAGY